MSEPKKRKGRHRSLRHIAEELGYTNGEFTVRRIQANIRKVNEWCDDLRHGIVPAELGAGSVSEAWMFVHQQNASIMEDERKWAKFFNAELKAIEHSADPESPPVIQIVQYGGDQTPK